MKFTAKLLAFLFFLYFIKPVYSDTQCAGGHYGIRRNSTKYRFICMGKNSR